MVWIIHVIKLIAELISNATTPSAVPCFAQSGGNCGWQQRRSVCRPILRHWAANGFRDEMARIIP